MTKDWLPFPCLSCTGNNYMIDGDRLKLVTPWYMPLLADNGTAHLVWDTANIVQLKYLQCLNEPYNV